MLTELLVLIIFVVYISSNRWETKGTHWVCNWKRPGSSQWPSAGQLYFLSPRKEPWGIFIHLSYVCVWGEGWAWQGDVVRGGLNISLSTNWRNQKIRCWMKRGIDIWRSEVLPYGNTPHIIHTQLVSTSTSYFVQT